MDFYAILGVPRTATPDEIKAAYRKMAFQYHPDRNPGDHECCEKFKECTLAYDTLSDEKKRATYDLGSTYTSGPKHPHNWDSFFHNTPETRGRNLQMPVEITLEEAFSGTTKKIQVDKKCLCAMCNGQGHTEFKACKKCSGSGKMFHKLSPFNMFGTCDACAGTGRAGVKSCEGCKGDGFINVAKESIDVAVPRGLDTGMQIRILGRGEPSKTGGRPGDLSVVIMVKDHAYLKRHGKDLHVSIPLCYSEFVIGTVVVLKDLKGREIKVVIPKNSTPHTQLRIEGKGMPEFPSNHCGDIIVSLACFVPAPLNAEHQELLRKLLEMESSFVTGRDHFGR